MEMWNNFFQVTQLVGGYLEREFCSAFKSVVFLIYANIFIPNWRANHRCLNVFQNSAQYIFVQLSLRSS